MSALQNEGSIIGGNGGLGGRNYDDVYGHVISRGRAGAGGVGVYADGGNSIINAGTIAGGMSGDGVTQAPAILFAGSNNSLELWAGSAISGNVDATAGTNNALILGGATDSSFDLSQIGLTAQYRGFRVFRKTGTSLWTLTGTGASITPWSVEAGTLQVGSDASPNTLLNGDVQVDSAGTLRGRGTIVGNVTNNGIVRPGASIGTLTIDGNYVQNANATLLVDVSNAPTTKGQTSDTGYSRLVVTGNVTLSPGASISLSGTGAAYGFALAQRFVVIQARTGATVSYNAGLLNYGVSDARYALTGADVTDAASGARNLVVTVGAQPAEPTIPSDAGATPSIPSPIRPTTPAAIASLGGLQSYTGVGNLALLNLYNASLAIGSVSEANHAGAQLSPAHQLAASRAAAAPTFNTLSLVGARADSLRLAQSGSRGVATGDGAPVFGLWGQGFGGHASQGMVDDIAGYSANYGGLMLGVDRAIGDKWLAGGVFSFSHTKINGSDDNSGSSTQVNGYGLLAYASYFGSPWYVNLSGGVVQQRYNTTRVMDFTGFSGVAKGAFSGQQYVARTEFGYPLALGSGTLTPLASLTYSYLHQGSYTETAGNGAALSVGTAHTSSLRSALGARLEKAYATRYGDIMPFVQVQWIHEFVNSRALTGASYAGDFTGETAFTAVGPSPVRDLADITLGATLMRRNNLSLTARYELQAGARFVSQTGSLRLQQRF
ncbi:autotransporter domain-containing protein [Pandoraea sp. CB10b_02]|uniref:autotransporter family protein n=1 Tax=Pandoraea sp. CB10b_02 TaxID=2014535 RepID=UPI00257DA8DC|nr:autotransporter domain-containing protein [Pandoraea sp. CB10b_02]